MLNKAFLCVFCLTLILTYKLQAQGVIPLNKYGEEIKKKEKAYYYKRLFSSDDQKDAYHILTKDLKLVGLWVFIKDKNGEIIHSSKTTVDSLGNKTAITNHDYVARIVERTFLKEGKPIKQYYQVLKSNATYIKEADSGEFIETQRVIHDAAFKEPNDWNDFLAREITYPTEARRNGDSGTVKAALYISKEGKLSHVEIANSAFMANSLCKEVRRLVNKYDGDFYPALDLEGNPVDDYFIVPIRFVLN
ncbi:hypothetical protein DN752_03825 [Echinicola strongylocentroti]|uniref:TonB C-terminal domain-containing protein n=1 Tax=Echinicola strongylocentroti TaxID=1795355 RepID=A0A2Z4IF61_9BACT|nr:energy transducer TonB [Echinicola strongylocentroti]AWW29340.1 hypothetical protein DN752_03825 [Echinicola strongylocentroti]